MNLLLGLALVVGGIVLVAVARPREDVPRPFLRSAFVELMFPVLCLTILVIGAAILVTGLIE